jgi:hypothetical protein
MVQITLGSLFVKGEGEETSEKHRECRHKGIRQGKVDIRRARVRDIGEAAADHVKERIGREMLPYVRRHDGHG